MVVTVKQCSNGGRGCKDIGGTDVYNTIIPKAASAKEAWTKMKCFVYDETPDCFLKIVQNRHFSKRCY